MTRRTLYAVFRDYYRNECRKAGTDEYDSIERIFADMLTCSEEYRKLIFADDVNPFLLSATDRKLYEISVLNAPSMKSLLLYLLMRCRDGKISSSVLDGCILSVASFAMRSKICGGGISAQFAGSVIMRVDAAEENSDFQNALWKALFSGKGKYTFPSDGTFTKAICETPIIPYIWQWMTETYGEDHAHFCTGVETQTARDDSGLPKDHDIDALCIACIGSGITPARRLPRTFEIVQFRRHDRALIKSQRERTYRLDGRAVCRNRHKRFEQEGDSLEESRQKHPDQVSRLTVTKSTRYYNNPNRIMPGAVFLFGGERYVLRGQNTRGRYYNAIGCEKRNFPAAKCTIIRENAGLVYV